MPNVGDYVLVTRWSDGCSQDPWRVGMLYGIEMWSDSKKRYFVADGDGRKMGYAYRKAKKITLEQGKYLVDNSKYFMQYPVSLYKILKNIN